MDIRLLETGKKNPYFNMAVDESVLSNIANGFSKATLRIYSWEPASVSIGYFQSLSEEVDLEYCDKFGIPYVRRITGGGAVYHDNEITYSLIGKLGLFPEDILASYELICSGVIKALKSIGVEAKFSPLNDITVKEKKISGNAQTRRQGCLLQHGTILLSVDKTKMGSALKVPKEKIQILDRVSGLDDFCKASKEQLENAIINGFSTVLKANIKEEKLTLAELEMAQKLESTKYSTQKWNFQR